MTEASKEDTYDPKPANMTVFLRYETLHHKSMCLVAFKINKLSTLPINSQHPRTPHGTVVFWRLRGAMKAAEHPSQPSAGNLVTVCVYDFLLIWIINITTVLYNTL